MPTDFLRPSGLHTEPRQDQQSRHMMLLAERSLVLEGPALDEDGSGSLEWDEFVNAVNALETGSPFDKLKF